jgi:hypothetical protein
MNSLDRIMEFVLAGVFLCVGSLKVVGYGWEKKNPETGRVVGLLGLPFGCTVAVGMIEILAAVALAVSAALVSPAILAPIAVSGLALTTLAALVCRTRRQQPVEPSVVLLLLTLFVVVGFWR